MPDSGDPEAAVRRAGGLISDIRGAGSRRAVSRAATVVLAVTVCLVPVPAAGDTPGAFELLERVRQAYAELESYSDLGEIEISAGPRGRERTSLHFFETAATASGQFQWRTHGETDAGFEERILWRADEQGYLFRSLYGQYKPVPSISAELAHGWGPGGYEALVVPLLLAGAGDALADPQAAVVDGQEACGERRCWAISLTRMAGAIDCRLLIDRETLMIREVTIELAGAGGRTPAAGDRPLRVRVRHHPGSPAPAAFAPPAGARRVADWEPSAAAGEAASEDPPPGSTFSEEITVSELTIVARIVDSRGEPIRDLRPDDLIVRVGPTNAPVLAVKWSSSDRPPAAIPPSQLAEARVQARAGRLIMDAQPPAPAGRLVVLFLQVDFEPSRIAGQLKILPDVGKLLRSLHPDDRVAIVSFDSHLKLWQDFTRDRRQAFEVLERAVSFGKPAARASRGVSLLEHWDFGAAAGAATPERALKLTAEALAPIAGEKDLIYMGWGLGRFGAGGVRMTAEYQPAVRALEAARVTVFVLDVSQADYHSLEVGLQNVAAHTGGTYERTLHFASQAVSRLARTIAGHYLVTIDRGAVPEARGRVTMRLKGRKGRVLFKPLTLG